VKFYSIFYRSPIWKIIEIGLRLLVKMMQALAGSTGYVTKVLQRQQWQPMQ